jgi:hypothetical protein
MFGGVLACIYGDYFWVLKDGNISSDIVGNLLRGLKLSDIIG